MQSRTIHTYMVTQVYKSTDTINTIQAKECMLYTKQSTEKIQLTTSLTWSTHSNVHMHTLLHTMYVHTCIFLYTNFTCIGP